MKSIETNEVIAEEIGQRIDQLRLEANVTQAQVAESAGISLKTYGNVVKGKGTFLNTVAVIRALGRMDLLESFVPESVFSPMELLKMKGSERQRASKRKDDSAGVASW